jgi:hypothetical protein
MTYLKRIVGQFFFLLFALVFFSFAAVILAVLAGDNEIIPRVLSMRISAVALAIAVTSTAVLTLAALFSAVVKEAVNDPTIHSR